MTVSKQLDIASTWFEFLNQGDLEKLVALYSETQLSFHPTLWNEHIVTPTRVEDYFLEFLSRKPYAQSYIGEIVNLGDRSFLYTGVAKLAFEVDNRGTNEVTSARFSFIWSRSDKNLWRIIHHHNSVVPTGL